MSDTWWAQISKALSAPFDPKQVKWRIGSRNKDKTRGMALAYIDARDVMQRLDDAVGPGNWQDQYHASTAYAGQVICLLAIRDPETKEWIWKSDGAGSTGMEEAKGSLSDAFKRAAVKWGVGRYLYAVESRWVALENERFIPESELERLYRTLGAATIPEGALASPEDMPASPSGELKVGSGRLLTKAQFEQVLEALAQPSSRVLEKVLVEVYNVPREAIPSKEAALDWIQKNVRQSAVEGLLKAISGEVPSGGGDFEF